MSIAVIALLVLGLGAVAWLSGRARATAFAAPGGEARDRPHSRPGQHGWYVALWTVLPAGLRRRVFGPLARAYPKLDWAPRPLRAKATFEAFPPSRQREYAEWIAEAKTGETRERRLETAIEWMEEGKPRMWKYLKK